MPGLQTPIPSINTTVRAGKFSAVPIHIQTYASITITPIMKYHPFLLPILPLLLASCSPVGPKTTTPEKPHAGLGEIMLTVQMHHAKLWFAGINQSWELAKYELNELKECFEDVVTFHPTHKNVPQPLTTLVPTIITPALNRVEKSIDAKDAALFASAFDGLNNSCNGCHEAANHGFNVIKTPDVPPITNQDYTPRKLSK